jgi:hypothetical protein
MAFNLGSPGDEKKVTVLGIVPKTSIRFFIKYAETKIARENVRNEAISLQQLIFLDFVPSLLDYVDNSTYTLIKTNVIDGDRIYLQPIDIRMVDLLLILSKQEVKTNKSYSYGVGTCFGHGDFCPWNMMLYKGKYKVYDWEMAGNYPFGFDLFTYIFQTSFLLSPKTKINDLIKDNLENINYYFSCLAINNWKEYLLAFASVKLEIELNKKNMRLIIPYQLLRNHAKEL